MTLDARFQYIEAQTRKRPGVEGERAAPAARRPRPALNCSAAAKVRQVRTERVYITGRSHSVPAGSTLPHVRDNSAAMLVYYHFGGGVIGSLESCHRLCG